MVLQSATEHSIALCSELRFPDACETDSRFATLQLATVILPCDIVGQTLSV